MYSSDKDSIISTPLASTVDIIKAVAKKWKNMDMNVKNKWKLLARKINVLPILGSFESIPTRIIEKDVKTALSRDHYQLISTMSSTLHKRRKISPIDSMLAKKFGKETVQIGAKVFKSFCLSYLLKLCLFGPNYSLLNIRSTEIVERTKKTIIMHVRSMDRVMILFYCKWYFHIFGYRSR